MVLFMMFESFKPTDIEREMYGVLLGWVNLYEQILTKNGKF